MAQRGSMANVKRCKTIKARMYKETYEELRFKFPKTDMSDLIDIAYNTSALRIEAALRKKKKNEIL
jgi:hypothetical protein